MRDRSAQFILGAIEACKKEKRGYRSYESWKKALNYEMIYHSGAKAPAADAQRYETGMEEWKPCILETCSFIRKRRKGMTDAQHLTAAGLFCRDIASEDGGSGSALIKSGSGIWKTGR